MLPPFDPSRLLPEVEASMTRHPGDLAHGDAVRSDDPMHEPTTNGMSRRRTGRPLEMTAEQVLQAIHARAAEPGGLFRVHVAAPALYARARRLFGSWSAAVRRAGVDYDALQTVARVRSLETRRRNRRDTTGDRRSIPRAVR
jgi:hypothetical protein